MSGPTLCALLLVAAAMWCWPGPAWTLQRIADTVVPPDDTERRWRRGGVRDDPFAVAASFDLFAVCLRAGLPTGAAADIVAHTAPPGLARPLRSTAELLSLGADPERAWRRFADDTGSGGRRPARAEVERFDALATLARRSARSGSSLSQGLSELADGTRRRAHDDAVAAAERAGVAISGPLGLCFLPAFVCLGIVPVVIGLAATVL
ncbi:type II secretion system F family protein [Gordonia sp. CPCC 206044]|uniref:type II secretion system F family protein n=1 Tax=Gordonia sp. CPCC 206044 TaxID=3140793 RepID=UPI003AF3F6CA